MQTKDYTWEPSLSGRDPHNLIKFMVDGGDEALKRVFMLIAKWPANEWTDTQSELLDSLYRTRFRQLTSVYAPRATKAQLLAFARHLNLVATQFETRSRWFGQRIQYLESLMNDAIDEMENIESGRFKPFDPNLKTQYR
jgi:hypothetical protein